MTDLQYRTDAPNVGLLENAYRLVLPELDRTEFQDYLYVENPDGGVKLIPENSLRAAGVDTLTRQRVTSIGQWRLAADYSTNIESVGFALESVTYQAHYFRAHIDYSTRELDRIAFANQNGQMGIVVDIVGEKILAIDETYMQKLNSINAVGIPRLNIFGLHTHPDIPRLVAPYRLGLSRTPDENLAVLSLFSRTIKDNTSHKEKPNVLLLSNRAVSELSLQKVGTGGETSTLRYFLDNDPNIETIESTPELDTLGPNGTEIAQAYNRDPKKLDYMVPKPKTQIGPIQFYAGVYRQDFDAQFGGVHFRRPYSSLIMEFPAS